MDSTLIADFTVRYSADSTVSCQLELDLQTSRRTVLYGPSGSGKTTVLRALAGLERPVTGRIQFGGTTWFDSTENVFVSPQRRQIGYLAQEYALFPHLSVRRNLEYGASDGDGTSIDALVNMLGLEGLLDRRPPQLSGGQRQRVALGRALATRPRLLLLDEPLSALDTPMRAPIRSELRDLLDQSALPAIIVTHDRAEALGLGDAIVVVVGGRTVESGPASDVFSRPRTLESALATGVETVLEAEVQSCENGMTTVRLADSDTLLSSRTPFDTGRSVSVLIRAEDVRLSRSDSSEEPNRLRLKVASVTGEGAVARVRLEGGVRLTALVSGGAADLLRPERGEELTAIVPPEAVHLV